MSEIAFYHCTRSTVPQALVVLLHKLLDRGERALILLPTPERLKFFDEYLWTYAEDSFLPHGCHEDGHAEDQPIWLSIDDYPANNAVYVILLEGAACVDPLKYKRVIYLFDGNQEVEVMSARQTWKDYKDKQNFTLTYYAQGADASWQKNQ